MSHDIRTPMNAIIGFTHLALENKEDSEKLKDYLNNIDISSRKLLDILNSVLEVARIENNKIYLEEELNDMAHFYKDLLSMFDSQVQGKNLTINYEQKMVHRYFYVDLTKLNEIVINLVSNAIKYTPEGGEIKISSAEYPIEGSDDMVTVETIIEDNGIGMSEDFQKHLFENFSRERTEATDGIQGTGLGLAIVKKLVEIMNGTIEVESELGKGSKFIIRVPHRFGNMPDNAKTEQEDDEVSTEIFKGKRILLAEDNELNAEIAKAVLQDVGFIVEHAADGVICVDMYKNAEPGYYDMILMDIQMPNMNGYKATHYIRSMEDKVKANIPIIAMTANAFKEDVENVINAGMNGHIAKPLERDKMFRTLADALK
jgi:CheY-like chemotaxis protein